MDLQIRTDMNWDDLRIFLAVAEAGSLSGAARQLGINHSTVYRRINTLESSQNVRLFERMDRGYLLTVEGEEMKRATEQMATEIDALERKLSGHDMRLSGNIRVTTTDTLIYRLLTPHLAAFKSTYPGIDLEIIVNTQNLDLTKREADIAIRPTNKPPETLVGRRLYDINIGVYGSKSYLDRHGNLDDLSAHTWLALDESLAHIAGYKWMRDNLTTPRIALTSNNFFTLMSGAIAGMGLALLPGHIGDNEPELKQVLKIDPSTSLWLLTHADLRRTARIRAFMDFMYEHLMQEHREREARSQEAERP